MVFRGQMASEDPLQWEQPSLPLPPLPPLLRYSLPLLHER